MPSAPPANSQDQPATGSQITDTSTTALTNTAAIIASATATFSQQNTFGQTITSIGTGEAAVFVPAITVPSLIPAAGTAVVWTGGIALAGGVGYGIGTLVDKLTGFSTWVANTIVGPVYATTPQHTVPPIPADPTTPPASGWTWKGNGPPGSGQGSWVDPTNGQSLYPDLLHPPPIGPHWDWTDPSGGKWRVPPGGGTPTPKS